MNKAPLKPRHLEWAGIVGPALFVASFTLEGWLRPGYEPNKMYVSELALGSHAWIQTINFIVFGLLLLGFTRAAAARFQNGKGSKAGIILLTIIAACYLAFGVFVMDPVGTPPDEMTLPGLIHGLLGELVLLLMPISCFVFILRFREAGNWQRFRRWSLILGTISAAAGLLLIAAFNLPGVQNSFIDWLGLIQRAAILPFMAWLVIFSIGLLRE
jgi:hypothetical protein